MPTCCWYGSATCCGLRNQMYNLTVSLFFVFSLLHNICFLLLVPLLTVWFLLFYIQMIVNQISDLSKRGLSDQCYITLSNFLCNWCAPTTNDFLAINSSSYLAGNYGDLFICPSFCDKLFYNCFNDFGLIASNRNFTTSREFCSFIILDNFFQKANDLFPDMRVFITNTDNYGCFKGAHDADVINYGALCLPANKKNSSNSGKDIVFPPSSASLIGPFSVVISSLLVLFALL